MRVSVYKEAGGTFAIMVEASPGKGRSPVVKTGLLREDIAGWVRPAVDVARGPKAPRQSAPSL